MRLSNSMEYAPGDRVDIYEDDDCVSILMQNEFTIFGATMTPTAARELAAALNAAADEIEVES